MINVKNLTNNPNIQVTSKLGSMMVLEHQIDKSVSSNAAINAYFSAKMNIKKKQLLIQLNNSGVVTQKGAMQWITGNIESTTGIKGAGDLIGKMFASKVTGETAIKPEYTGTGLIMLEPTYKHILLLNVADWGQLTIEDGAFYACDATVQQNLTARKTLSSAVAGGEGLFNLSLSGQGIVALESTVPYEELVLVELNNDTLKIDGNFAVAWSTELQFTVERSSKTLLGSAVNGEGLVNVYRGTGKVLMRNV